MKFSTPRFPKHFDFSCFLLSCQKMRTKRTLYLLLHNTPNLPRAILFRNFFSQRFADVIGILQLDTAICATHF